MTFYCQIDKEPLRICGKSFSHRFTKGKHAVRVRAKDEAGNLAEKQTVFHFRVKQIPPKRSAAVAPAPLVSAPLVGGAGAADDPVGDHEQDAPRRPRRRSPPGR